MLCSKAWPLDLFATCLYTQLHWGLRFGVYVIFRHAHSLRLARLATLHPGGLLDYSIMYSIARQASFSHTRGQVESLPVGSCMKNMCGTGWFVAVWCGWPVCDFGTGVSAGWLIMYHGLSEWAVGGSQVPVGKELTLRELAVACAYVHNPGVAGRFAFVWK
jgi:hypothetical protein